MHALAIVWNVAHANVLHNDESSLHRAMKERPGPPSEIPLHEARALWQL